MANDKFKDLSLEELKKKEVGHKTILWIFAVLIAGLSFFLFRSYFQGEELDWALLTITICTLGGPATIYPELKQIREEINSRRQ